MTARSKDFQGYLGMILGAVAAALLHTGSGRQEIHGMLDLAFRAYDAGPKDARITEAIGLIQDASEDFAGA